VRNKRRELHPRKRPKRLKSGIVRASLCAHRAGSLAATLLAPTRRRAVHQGAPRDRRDQCRAAEHEHPENRDGRYDDGRFVLCGPRPAAAPGRGMAGGRCKTSTEWGDRHAERADRLTQSYRSTWFRRGSLIGLRIAEPSSPPAWMAAHRIAPPRSGRSGSRAGAIRGGLQHSP
jgi:hypothetical protein